MNLPLFIARRYLFAHKSHNVINIISGISAAGMAIGTAALIIILSIYNGFDSLVKGLLGSVDPDFLIEPATGKVFIPDSLTFSKLHDMDEIRSMCTILQEQVFVDYDGSQGIAVAKGVDETYEEESPLGAHVRYGKFKLHHGEIRQACIGLGLAGKMSINPNFLSSLDIYYPTRTGKISTMNPISSLKSVSVHPSGIFSVNSEIDESLIILPMESMRELLEYDSDEVSAVEIRLQDGLSARQAKKIQKTILGILGDNYRVSDRYMQNESIYKMMKYEKAAIFLILIAIIIIIAFNIFGSLTMLIIEKDEDIETLRSMGATDSFIRKTFTLEGWMISILGMAVGLAAGLAIAFMQQKFGIIKMPGNFIVRAYPVIISFSDIILTAAGVTLIGYLIARLPVSIHFRKA